ncbi:probable palmitoyltransferase ZDHHC1 isoform X3 [Calypte anna]|uniref:probable palmitoyltransferase ZDHHC1 isoform X3 n=1 Tax=Calypte anna TaxID=9244 RepID=UPI0011C3AD3C|nr:probable palmitoyltransferase ZDHHC1 isoform X3 [Calypte anna]
MNICNKTPNKTAPEILGEAVPEVQAQRARRNGWSWPLHLFQILAWFLYLFFALVGFGILVPLLPRHWLPAGYIGSVWTRKGGAVPAVCTWGQILCPGVCFIYHLVVHLTAVSIDPADANVREKNYLGPLATFNRDRHTHVIENHHCHVCDVNVSAKSKHCGTCNKCVCGFDHHCKWLNNCVGERNYWLFLNSVLSAILGLAPLLLVACYVFVEFFLDPGMLRSDGHFDALKNQADRWLVFLPAAPVETQASAILVTAGLFILLSLMTVILLGHLLTFHIYLMWNKLTTYEYILQQRPQQEAKEGDKHQESSPSQLSPSQEADFFPGNPGSTNPGIQVEEFSTVTSGKEKRKSFLFCTVAQEKFPCRFTGNAVQAFPGSVCTVMKLPLSRAPLQTPQLFPLWSFLRKKGGRRCIKFPPQQGTADLKHTLDLGPLSQILSQSSQPQLLPPHLPPAFTPWCQLFLRDLLCPPAALASSRQQDPQLSITQSLLSPWMRFLWLRLTLGAWTLTGLPRRTPGALSTVPCPQTIPEVRGRRICIPGTREKGKAASKTDMGNKTWNFLLRFLLCL